MEKTTETKLRGCPVCGCSWSLDYSYWCEIGGYLRKKQEICHKCKDGSSNIFPN